MWLDLRKSSFIDNYKYLEIPILIIWSMVQLNLNLTTRACGNCMARHIQKTLAILAACAQKIDDVNMHIKCRNVHKRSYSSVVWITFAWTVHVHLLCMKCASEICYFVRISFVRLLMCFGLHKVHSCIFVYLPGHMCFPHN